MSIPNPPIPLEALRSLQNGSPQDEQEVPIGDVPYGLAVPTIARTLRDVVVSHFGAAGNPVPERRVIVPGTARDNAWDCDDGSLQVGMIGIGWGSSPGTGTQGGASEASQLGTVMRHVVMEVCLVRRGFIPDQTMGPSMPTADEVSSTGLQSMRDAGQLSEAVMRASELLTAGLTTLGCLVTTGTIEPIGPSGKLYGLVTPFTVTLGERE